MVGRGSGGGSWIGIAGGVPIAAGQGDLRSIMRSPPWRIPLSLMRGETCERFVSTVISICMDGRLRIRKCLSGRSLYVFRTTKTSR